MERGTVNANDSKKECLLYSTCSRSIFTKVFQAIYTLPVRFNGIERHLRFFIGEDYTTSREQFIFPEWKRGGSAGQDPRVRGYSSRTGCLGAGTPPAPE